MPPTTLHINGDLLSRIDEAASEKGNSRNRFGVEACETALESLGPSWPKGFFDNDLTELDLRLLREASTETEGAIFKSRKNRGRPSL